MRIVHQEPHDVFRVVIYSWNEKYLLEIEAGVFKQVFKFDQSKISLDDVKAILNEEFMDSCLLRFRGMKDDVIKSMKK